ncbi:tetratricopeptide repeat protein [Fulvivirgaceae bacterium BMA12]|uniref:Tetratricopeptide repeat protein n=1 Tax=Agaribacillus aureus TaxID=3051825 RepID=A0ABT8LCE1_9BACT|nr:tetratricopeptide repeat protein [Fulvivirgaceae bacterium BMA12]
MIIEHLSKIQLLIERDKLDLAQQQITEALTSYPDSATLFGLQAEVYLKKKAYKKAKTAVNTGLGLDPEDDYLYMLKSQIWLHLGYHNEALKAVDEAILHNPEIAAYYGIKAEILMLKKQFGEAEKYAKKGLEVDPEDLLSNNILSMAQNKLGQSDQAYERLENMLMDDPENSLTQANTGYHFLQRGEIKKAKEHFAIALQDDPNFEFARSGMLEAIKASNWLYRQLLLFSFWIEKLGAKNKWLFFIGLIVVVKLIPVLLPFYLVFVFWTWFTGPISDVMLYFDRYGKYLMTDKVRTLTQINIGLIGLSLASVGLGLGFNSGFFGLAFGAFLSIIPVYQLDYDNRLLKKFILSGFAILFIGLGIAIVAASLTGATTLAGLWLILSLSAVAFTWISSFIN